MYDGSWRWRALAKRHGVGVFLIAKYFFFCTMMVNYAIKNAHAVPLASACQHPENHKENQAGHSPERAVEGQRA